MKTELIIRSNSSDIDFALLKDGKLIELQKDEESNDFKINIELNLDDEKLIKTIESLK